MEAPPEILKILDQSIDIREILHKVKQGETFEHTSET